MKDYCLELVKKQVSSSSKYNIMREYVQAYCLKIMQEAGQFQCYAFVGGTALRFLYDLPRFSEDLVFSLVKSSALSFRELMLKIRQELFLAGYSVIVTYNDEKPVHSAFIKFEGLLFEAELSSLKSERFSVKVEVDMHPPEGAVLRTKIVNKFFPIAFTTYDLPSLFSGKIHAVLNRKYVKGRDYYDIAWYLSRDKTLQPNILLLSTALKQTNWKWDTVTQGNWRSILSEQIRKADWEIVNKDVTNFLERPEDLKVFTKENVLQMINDTPL